MNNKIAEMKLFLPAILVLFLVSAALAEKQDNFQILKEEQTLYDEVGITAKCLNGVVVSIRCIESKTRCGVDSKPLDTALERACAAVMPPPTPPNQARR